MSFAIAVALLVLLNIAVVRWGADSREPGDWRISGWKDLPPRVDQHLDVGGAAGG